VAQFEIIFPYWSTEAKENYDKRQLGLLASEAKLETGLSECESRSGNHSAVTVL
jgi:hypothetical protein